MDAVLQFIHNLLTIIVNNAGLILLIALVLAIVGYFVPLTPRERGRLFGSAVTVALVVVAAWVINALVASWPNTPSTANNNGENNSGQAPITSTLTLTDTNRLNSLETNVGNLQQGMTTLGNKLDTLGSKLDTLGSSASNGNQTGNTNTGATNTNTGSVSTMSTGMNDQIGKTNSGIDVLDKSQMPAWLAANVGGRADQWHLVIEPDGRFNGWQFYTKDGNAPNATLCPKDGRVDFGVWSDQSNWWQVARVYPGQCTYAKEGKPDSTIAIDDGRWYPTSQTNTDGSSNNGNSSANNSGNSSANNSGNTDSGGNNTSSQVNAKWLADQTGTPAQFWTSVTDQSGGHWHFKATDGKLYSLKAPSTGFLTYGVWEAASKSWVSSPHITSGSTPQIDSADYWSK